MNTDFNVTKLTASILMLSIAFPAWAHTGLVNTHSFSAGFAHPWLGVDHILMAFVVGFWSCYAMAKPAWYLPFWFLASMAFGVLFAYLGIDIPAVGLGITMPLWIIGLCIGLEKLPSADKVSIFAYHFRCKSRLYPCHRGDKSRRLFPVFNRGVFSNFSIASNRYDYRANGYEGLTKLTPGNRSCLHCRQCIGDFRLSWHVSA